MKILIATQYYYPETFPSTFIAEELFRRGHEVTVVTGLPNYGLEKIPEGFGPTGKETRNGVRIVRLPLHKRKKGLASLLWNYLSFWRSSLRYFKSVKTSYDLVLVLNFSPITSLDGASKFAEREGIPLVINVFDLWPESAIATGACKEGSFFYRRLYKLSSGIYSRAKGFIFSSPSFANYFHDVLHIDKPGVYCPQSPIEDAYKNVSPSPFLPNEKALVYVGNLGKIQPIDCVIDALAALPEEERPRLYLIGDGSEKARLEAKASSLSLSEEVLFLGHLSPSECASYQRNALANLVLMKRGASPVYDTIPNKLISALSFGRPILGLIGGAGESVLKEAGGSYLCEEDPKDVAQTIKSLMALKKTDIKEKGNANRVYFESHYDSMKTMDDYEAFLRSMTEER